MSKLSAVACDVYWTGCIGLGVLDWILSTADRMGEGSQTPR
jgi:hypothetical protein